MATFLVVIGRLFPLSCNAGQTWMDKAARLLASLAVAIRTIRFIPYLGKGYPPNAAAATRAPD
jgi:hypothetical protein